MQQLYLTGSHASRIALQLFRALNVRPVGFRLAPFEVDGNCRGEAVDLLLSSAAPMYNGVPCRIRLSPDRTAVVTAALEEVAAPGILAATGVHAPILLDGLHADMLRCKAFREAIHTCLTGQQPVVVTAAPDAVAALRRLTPPESQLWFAVPEDEAGQSALLEQLLPEAALRF